MKNIIISIILLGFTLSIIACRNSTEDPSAAARAFYEAMSVKDFEKAALYATKDSKTLLDLVKSMAEMGAEINTGPTDLEKLKSATYSTEKMDDDIATVKIKMGEEENSIKLKKEDGSWKVALDKESLKESISEKRSEQQEASKQ